MSNTIPPYKHTMTTSGTTLPVSELEQGGALRNWSSSNNMRIMFLKNPREISSATTPWILTTINKEAGEVSWLAVEVLSQCRKLKSRFLKQDLEGGSVWVNWHLFCHSFKQLSFYEKTRPKVDKMRLLKVFYNVLAKAICKA